MEILVLGSGTSHGVPMIGCTCEVCRSANPKNRRFRPSVLVRNGEPAILVDTGPELRMQSLAFHVSRVDAVLITHTHADHIFGLDDLRRFNDLANAEIPVYGDRDTLDDIRRIFPYIFRETQLAGGKPRLTLHETPPEFMLCGLKVSSMVVMHGRLPVLAYRFDDEFDKEGAHGASFAYVTDVSHIPEEAMDKLRGLDLLILDAVRPDPHPTHFGLYQALEVIAELKPRRSLLTHLSHKFDHDEVNARLPPGVELAYDGQTISL